MVASCAKINTSKARRDSSNEIPRGSCIEATDVKVISDAQKRRLKISIAKIKKVEIS